MPKFKLNYFVEFVYLTSLEREIMSFGQKILEKYGYKSGTGLGKNENGIVEPIKANYKVIFKTMWFQKR